MLKESHLNALKSFPWFFNVHSKSFFQWVETKLIMKMNTVRQISRKKNRLTDRNYGIAFEELSCQQYFYRFVAYTRIFRSNKGNRGTQGMTGSQTFKVLLKDRLINHPDCDFFFLFLFEDSSQSLFILPENTSPTCRAKPVPCPQTSHFCLPEDLLSALP